MMTNTDEALLEAVRRQAVEAAVFASLELKGRCLECAAPNSAEPAWFRLERDRDGWFVSLVTADRWLSESIEADLMHHGDPIEDLIEEELLELGHSPYRPVVKHYRSDDMLYTFRSPIPPDPDGGEIAAETAAVWLLAYEAAFRELGDMEADDDD